MVNFLSRLIAPFRFISRWRARQSLARMREWRLKEEERKHQLALLQSFLTSLETIQATSAKEATSNSAALVEVAKAMTQQASGFAEWMKLFQVSSPPTSTYVRDEDEYQREQQDALEAGMPSDIAALPEEFRLAWALRNDANLIGQ